MTDLSNFANIDVNIISTDKERLTESMRKILYDRVWCDDNLLEGFTHGEIDEIVSRTLDRDFSTISQFLAVLLEDKANEYMKEHANASFGYTEEPLVSTDIIGITEGSLFDATQTMVSKIDEDTYHVQVVAWYDNENSYTSQMVRTIKYFAELSK